MLDVDHLTRQTLGNRDLQREVLGLFVRHSQEQLEKLAKSSPGRERRESAHSIVGAARAIGAFEVARIARAVEESTGPIEAELAELSAAIGKTRDFIAAFLAE